MQNKVCENLKATGGCLLVYLSSLSPCKRLECDVEAFDHHLPTGLVVLAESLVNLIQSALKTNE